MPIRLLVNGYFRSGTTFIWGYLKDSLEAHGFRSFYEPLHPSLATFARNEASGKENRLHQQYVFKEYLDLEEDRFLRILRNNPNANGYGIQNDLALRSYLDLFQELPEDVFIQDNRLHFHLDLIFDFYTSKVVHIVRHPLDVWLSLKKAAYSLVEDSTLLLAHQIAAPFRLKNAFEIDKQYHWIINQIGYPYNYDDTLSTKIFNRYNAFEKFVVVWTIANYVAMKTTVQKGGLLLVYEHMVDCPTDLRNTLSSFLAMELPNIPQVKEGNYHKFSEKLERDFWRTIRKYKLDHEIDYIFQDDRVKDVWQKGMQTTAPSTGARSQAETDGKS